MNGDSKPIRGVAHFPPEDGQPASSGGEAQVGVFLATRPGGAVAPHNMGALPRQSLAIVATLASARTAWLEASEEAGVRMDLLLLPAACSNSQREREGCLREMLSFHLGWRLASTEGLGEIPWRLFLEDPEEDFRWRHILLPRAGVMQVMD